LNDIQFEQAKFIKLAKKGRKNKNDQAKETGTIIHLIHYNSFNQSINSYSLIEQQRILELNNRRQQQLCPIFNNSKSILLAKPQTPKPSRSHGRPRKNTQALNFS
jgi:hypothetical protein